MRSGLTGDRAGGAGASCPAAMTVTADANGKILIYSDPAGSNGDGNAIKLVAQ
jgi:hypothetical protein